jgi:hypothetical protein
LLAGVSLVVSLPITAQAEESAGAKFVRALDRMMVQLAPQSARDSKTIRAAYREHLDLLVLNQYAELEAALWNGGVAPLPGDPVRFNLAPRLEGPSPIGEKDLANQISYIAARPATIGALLDVASRVKSGPLEVTSLVRHTEYQGALRATNVNATTSVPMHTMGLAFDIALVNTPLETVYEIRDVLLRMRKAGEILFIGERKQLVFHVVPHPSRLGHFTQVYTQAFGIPPAAGGAHVVAFSGGGKGAKHTPAVSAEIIAVLPADGFVDEWWAANHDHGDIAVQVLAEPLPEPAAAPSVPQEPQTRLPGVFLALLAAASGVAIISRILTGPSAAGLFQHA